MLGMSWLYGQIKRWLRPHLKAILLTWYRSINREPWTVASKLPHAPRIIHLSNHNGAIFLDIMTRHLSAVITAKYYQ